MSNFWLLRCELDDLADELYGILFVGSAFRTEKEIFVKFENNKQWIYDQHPTLNGKHLSINFVIDKIKDAYFVKKVIIY